MNIPKPIADEMASIEADIAAIQKEAARRVAALQERLDIYSFVVDAFVSTEHAAIAPARPVISHSTSGGYDYDALVAIMRDGGDAGVPKSALPIDHPCRLSVLKSRGIAQKLPSGNWALAASNP